MLAKILEHSLTDAVLGVRDVIGGKSKLVE
jgi:hypothetical protein